MGSRKRSKPNPKAETELQLPVQRTAHEPENRALQEDEVKLAAPKEEHSTSEAASGRDLGTKSSRSTESWYGGTWPRGTKAASVTQVVKESISASGGAASNFVARSRPAIPNGGSTTPKNPAPYLSRNIGSSSRSLPLAATTTKLNITSNASSIPDGSLVRDMTSKSDEATPKMQTLKPIPTPIRAADEAGPRSAHKEEVAQQDIVVTALESVGKPTSGDSVGNDTYGWLGWFSKPSQSHGQEPKLARDSQGNGQAIGNTTKDSSSHDSDLSQAGKAGEDQRRSSDPNPVAAASQREQQTRSWLSLWSNTNAPSEKSAATFATEPLSVTPPKGLANTAESEQRKLQSGDDLQPTPQDSLIAVDTTKSHGWSFWSKDRSKDIHMTGAPNDYVGKLALAGSSSQSQPENATADQVEGLPSKWGKRERPKSLSLNESSDLPDNSKGESERSGNPKKPTSKTKSGDQALSSVQKSPTNLVLPTFKRTYRVAEKPSIFQHLSRLLQYNQLPNTKHLDIILNPPRIKRAIAIGVHGYFPAPLIRSVLGQPTGTSLRFANGAASAIQRWTQKHGYSCEVEKVALEGEGKIAERIDLLWRLMLNWIGNIRKADFVMIACHSQGVPVAISLVAKLISFGCVNSAKIGICAMAGVNLGPFADYKSRWIGGSAGELFDFARPESQVSKDYRAALEVALGFGVKIVYIGSIDDQLVSLESSTFGSVIHPYIYRAVFVDGRVHAPDFLTHLVGFALKLRNLAISDHGLIRELSSPLAGSLYGGEGHSRIYDDDAVYYLAVEHALETSSIGTVPLKIPREGTGTSQNPYILPFAIRGLLEEDYVRTELAHETAELLREFDDWKPSSKVLKDVKFRLEGVRSKL